MSITAPPIRQVGGSAKKKLELVPLLLEKGADLNKGEQRRSDIHGYQTRYLKKALTKIKKT